MNAPQPTPSPGTVPHAELLPDELLAANHRMAARRARSSRALVRARTRRRVIPSVVAISVAMVGAGAADAYVNRTVAQPTITTRPPVTPSAQNAANARSLAQVSRALAADQRALAALMAGAQRVRSSVSGAPSGGVATSPTPAPSTARPTPTPAATTPAPAPTPAPATHTTTGASSAPVG